MFVTRADGVKIHHLDALAHMRRAGKVAASVLDEIEPYVKPGVSTERLDFLCNKFIQEKGAISACLNYKMKPTDQGFQKHVCTSVNEVVCHGIPNAQEILRDGDIINIDVTVILDGWHGDTSRMFFVGKKISMQARKVVKAAYEAMMAGISVVKPGGWTGDVGHAISKHAGLFGFSVVRDYCGHGIGTVFHDQPQIMNFGTPGTGARFEPGMFFTVEPMVNVGTHRTRVKKDGWGVVTVDGSLSAQFEHTIAVTENGFEILTLGAAT